MPPSATKQQWDVLVAITGYQNNNTVQLTEQGIGRMYQSQIRSTVALIAIFGHLIVVFLGLYLLVIAGPFSISDGVQILLIASPITAVLSVAGMKHILKNETNRRRGKKVNFSFSVIVITIPIAILSIILALFVTTYLMLGDFDLNGIKTALAGLEVIFGVYIGAISETLFGKPEESKGT